MFHALKTDCFLAGNNPFCYCLNKSENYKYGFIVPPPYLACISPPGPLESFVTPNSLVGFKGILLGHERVG